MKLANFSAVQVAQPIHHSTNDRTATEQQPDRAVQVNAFAPETGLFVLPVFSILLLLIFQSSRHLCSSVYNNLQIKYQNYRFSVQYQQVAALERAFNLKSALR